MYHGVTPRTMWEAEPTLYWRLKKNGKWTYERAHFVILRPYSLPGGSRVVSTIILEVQAPIREREYDESESE